MMPDLPLLLMYNLTVDKKTRRCTSFTLLKSKDFSESFQENWERHKSTTFEKEKLRSHKK